MTAPSIDVIGLLGQLELLTEKPEAPGALIFDADGTLWSGDVGIDVFNHALSHGLLREEARPALLDEFSAHGLTNQLPEQTPDDLDVNLLGQLLQRAFDEGHYPEQAATEMQVWAYAGFTEQELREHVRQALSHRQHVSRIYQPLLPLLLWARDRGLRTVIVSASPQVVVEEAAHCLGFPPADIAAGRAKRGPAGYLPALAERLPYGPGKVRAGRLLLGSGTEWLAVFGDSAFDAEMLSEAKLPVAVRPRPGLIDRLPEIPGAMLFAGTRP